MLDAARSLPRTLSGTPTARRSRAAGQHSGLGVDSARAAASRCGAFLRLAASIRATTAGRLRSRGSARTPAVDGGTRRAFAEPARCLREPDIAFDRLGPDHARQLRLDDAASAPGTVRTAARTLGLRWLAGSRATGACSKRSTPSRAGRRWPATSTSSIRTRCRSSAPRNWPGSTRSIRASAGRRSRRSSSSARWRW